jgi:uncharacterized RDD family membrane protein YckC
LREQIADVTGHPSHSRTASKLLRIFSLILVGLDLALPYFFHFGQIGDSMEWKNGNTSISAGSNPAVLLWDVIAVALYIVLMLRKSASVTEGVPSTKRRILAFLIDFEFSLGITASVGALVPLSFEAIRTGHFAWYFHRNYAVKNDLLAAVVSLAFTVLMVLYFAFPLTRGRQTPGYFILRLKLAPPFGTEGRLTMKAALIRTYYAVTGGFPIFGRSWDRDSQGRTWYDRKTNCTVVFVDD